jgi:cobalt-zinc-cadmium efflux system outer membrane protein
MTITRILLGLSVLAGWAATASAQAPTDTLRLSEAISTARSANPMLAAARLRADAAAERIPQAGALPDPQLTLGLVNRPLDGFGTEEPMTMNVIGVSQMFPWPGKLGFAEDRARFLASAETQSAAETEATLVSRVKSVYYEVAAMDRAITIMERTRELLRDFFQVSQTMYAVGESVQQDVLRAQVAVAQMTEEITSMSQRRIAMAARLNALLGRDAKTPVGGLDLPVVGGELPSVDSLLVIASEQRPALQAAYDRARAAGAGYQQARRELYPDFMVSLEFGGRPQYNNMGTVMLGFNLPIWAGSKQLPMRREMQDMKAMETAMAQDVYNETVAELTEARAEVERARALTTLYATAIVPQSRAAVESALSAYRVGRVDYMTLVENEMTVNRYEIAQVQLAAQYHQALARIHALLGSIGGGQ